MYTINGFLKLLENFSWRSHRHTVRHSGLFQVQIHCAWRWIMTLAPKILTLASDLNTWTITDFQKPSFYNTNHTPPTSIDVWMMDSSWINTPIKTNWSAQHSILCRKWIRKKHTLCHSERTIFVPWQYPTQRTYIFAINQLFFSWISVLQRWPAARQETTAEDQADPVSWQQMSRLIIFGQTEDFDFGQMQM